MRDTTELTTYQQNLPDTIEDIAHFLLIAPEKATVLRAEIRAIEKVGLAKAVYDQKLEEQRRLCDMILDASVRLGEMTKQIQTASGQRNDLPSDSTVERLKPKSEAVRELGFTPKQVERFETLADNKDLVEQEKVTAREEGRMPTRTNVLDLAKARRDRYERDMAQIDEDGRISKDFSAAVHAVLKLQNGDNVANSLIRNSKGDVGGDIQNISDAITKLSIIKSILQKGGDCNGRF